MMVLVELLSLGLRKELNSPILLSWAQAWESQNQNFLSKENSWDFLSGQVVKTLCFHARDTGSISSLGTKIAEAMLAQPKEKKDILPVVDSSFLPVTL